MKRKSVSKNYSRKVFKKTAGLRTKRGNTSAPNQRGGRRM